MNPYLELLLRASLLILASLLMLAISRNRSAEYRVNLLRWTILGLAILPAIWALGPRWAFVIPGLAKPDPVIVDFDADVMSFLPTAVAETARIDLLPWVYVGIALLLLVPALVGHHILRKIWNKSMPLGWRLDDELDEALDTVGVKQIVEGRKGSIASPLVFGAIKRRILLPENFEEWPEEHRRSALLHEAAHLKRFDCAWQHLAHGVRAVYWCHPLVWFLSRALKDETELAADERAIRSGAEAADYASALVAIARTLQEPGRLVRSQGVTFMNHRQLDRRVRSVLHGRRRGFSSLGGLIMAAFAAMGTYTAAGLNPQKPQPELISAPSVRSAGAPQILRSTSPTQDIRVISEHELRTIAKEAKAPEALITITQVSPTTASAPARVKAGKTTKAATVRTVSTTAVVAPLPQKTTASPREGVPILKDLPLIGRLFTKEAQEAKAASAPVAVTTPSVARSAFAPSSHAIAQGSTADPFVVRGPAYRLPVNVTESLMHAQSGQELSKAEVQRALELLSKIEAGQDRDLAELRRLLEKSAGQRFTHTTTPRYLMRGAEGKPADDRNVQEYSRDLFNRVKTTETAKAKVAPKEWNGFRTLQPLARTAPVITGGNLADRFLERAPMKLEMPALNLGRVYNLSTGGTKPVTLKISIDGKMHEIKATPDKDGNVQIEVDANGNVRVIGGK